MVDLIERNSLDLRFQSYRIRNRTTEARLLASIGEQEIQEPLTGVDTPEGRLLLDGFKRYRCAEKLHIECVPYVSLGTEETLGIAALVSPRKSQGLSILEQARFVAELLDTHGLSIAEVAELLARSKAWVSTRRNLLTEMSPGVQQVLFRGRFSVYAYMSILRPFMRMNDVGQKEIERFVQALAGKKLSVRELELLAHGYFRGTTPLREAIEQGNWKWSLEQLQTAPEASESLNDTERKVLRELERLLKAMQCVMARCDDSRLQSRDFFAQTNLLLARLLSGRDSFFTKMEEFYDRSGRM